MGITDDYGTDIDLFESIDLRLEIVSATVDQTIEGLGLRLAADTRSKPSTLTNHIDFTFTPSRGAFHGLSLNLVSLSSKVPLPRAIRFRLSVAPPAEEDSDSQSSPESTGSKRIRQLIGEESQRVLETWNDNRYIFLSVESGEVELVRRSNTSNSSDKVQTTLRRIHMPSRAPITIVERPGLNNSTGQRLWDCAIGLSAYLSLHPNTSFNPSSSSTPESGTSESDDETSRSKKRRKTSKRVRIIELGAGCALASLTASQISQGAGDTTSVVATDIEATVNTTLEENLNFNESYSKVDKGILDWGQVSGTQVKDLLDVPMSKTPTTPQDLILVATDVLYNPESHQLLLDTLLSFLRPSPPIAPLLSSTTSRALIAYKRRTEGDDGFFELANGAGLEVLKVWEWSEVSVWSFT